jgi:hypothetical protein
LEGETDGAINNDMHAPLLFSLLETTCPNDQRETAGGEEQLVFFSFCFCSSAISVMNGPRTSRLKATVVVSTHVKTVART